MFEMTRLGAVFFVVGLVYLAVVRTRLLPVRENTHELTLKYRMDRYLTRLVVHGKSALLMRTAGEARLGEKYDVTVLEIIRGDERISSELRDTKFHDGDELLVRGSARSLMEISAVEKVSIRSQAKYADRDLTTEDAVLAEAVISPSSSLIGRTLKKANFRHRYGVLALAIQKHGATIRDKIGNIRLDVGDSLLIQGRREAVEGLWDDPSFLLLQEFEVSPLRRHKAPYALGIVALVVVLAALEIMPIVVSATAGCILLILCGCINLSEAYERVAGRRFYPRFSNIRVISVRVWALNETASR